MSQPPADLLPPDAPPLPLAELYAPVAADVEASAAIFRDELVSDQGFISDLCAHVARFHGKRLRPALLLLAARACGAVRPEHRVLAAVVEMVHIATLVHDDVLDEADIRRRSATVNRLWGNERAVLLGDYLISHAFHLCSSLPTPQAARMIAHTANTVCEGELMQVFHRENLALREAEYLDIISRKTASLIGVCGALGAIYAGAPREQVDALRQYGLAVGIAFQITDDLLDLTGDEAEVGKSLGRDVAKGKLTLPLIHFLRSQDEVLRARLITALRSADDQRYREVARLIASSNSIEYAQSTAERYVSSARQALDALPPSDARCALEAMAAFVLARRL